MVGKFGTAPSRNPTLTATVGMRTLGCGLSNLSGAKSRKEKIRLEQYRMSEAEYMEDGEDYLEEGCQRQTCDGCMACNYCLIKEQEDERGTANKERRQNYECMGRP